LVEFGFCELRFDVAELPPQAVVRIWTGLVRLAFANPVSTQEEVRATLISMVKDARSKLAAEAL